jgi:anthranilate phosphoribosyltransferase
VAEALHQLGTQRAVVVHGRDGLDEISTLGETLVAELADGEVSTYTLIPGDLGLERARVEDIGGGTPEQSAEMLSEVLQGQRGPRYDIVVANAGAVVYIGGGAASIQEGMEHAAEVIASGAAFGKLEQLRAFCGSA